MNKSEKQLEDLLRSQAEVGLTDSEKSVMFSELTAFAEFHSPQASVVKSRRHRFSLWARYAAGTTAALFIMVGTGFASTQSLPGEPLYSVKVSVVEPLFGFTYTSEVEQLAYHISLMERRLAEMETLYRSDTLTEAEVVVLEEQIDEHVAEVAALVVSEPAQVSPVATVEAVSTVATALKKQSFLVDKELGVTRPSVLDETQVEVAALYDAAVAEFVSEEPEAVTEYVEDLLSEVDLKVAADPETASSSALELTAHLADVAETLERGDLKQAVESADEAAQLLETNSFFEAIVEEAAPGDDAATE